MKEKQTAEEILNKHIEWIFASDKYKQMFVNAMEEYATQCQEDMADKKYTEEDMLKAFEKGALYGTTQNGNTHYFNEVINSLNKQFDIICPKCGGDSWKFNAVKTTIKYCKCGNDF